MNEAELSMAAGYVETTPAPSEKELFLRHRDGDPGAFRQLVTAYKASVYAFVCRSGVPSSDREDLFQEIFIKVHQAAHRYDEERELHPWFFTIVVNTTRSYFRRRQSAELSLEEVGPRIEAVASTRPSTERELAARETLERLEREILDLPQRHREALLLAVVENMSMSAIAEVLEVPTNTVKTWLRRARAQLMKRMGKEPL